VTNATRPITELIAHHVTVDEGTLSPGMEVRAKVNGDLRDQTRKNHSATHLLHLALKEVLGDHVQQKGSLVGPNRLRFDFSHFEALTADEIAGIEDRVNEMILANAETTTKVGSMEDAKHEGAVMLFGEKYGDEVRMVRIGVDSIELCGGTHVERAGDIGLFKLTEDSNIASGVRRVEAVTGMHALAHVRRQERVLQQASQALKASPDDVPDRIGKLLKRNKELERDLERAQTAAAMGGQAGADPLDGVEEIGGLKVLFKRADGTPKNSLRALADQLRDKLGSGVVVLAACDADKAQLLVAATKDVAGKAVHAGNVVKAATNAMGGKGGGRPDFAQGGGDAAKIDAALEQARAALAG
jgi:alanyl-tRNA synthetase